MLWMWIGFIAMIAALLALDLGVLHRKAHAVGVREAVGWSIAWIVLALGFSGLIYLGYERHWLGLGLAVDGTDGMLNDGKAAAAKFLTGYLVEKSLSVDNLFIIALLFGALSIPARFQHRVLFWGIVGAMVCRGAMVMSGWVLIERFHWMLYVFGAFLLITALRLLCVRDNPGKPAMNAALRFAQRWLPFTPELRDQRFLAKVGERWMLTPLALALITVEATDVVFALDSIPAIFAITADPFLVFTSNVFALLGLRSLYFALAAMMSAFVHLKTSLSAVLALIGAKMLAGDWLEEVVGPVHNLWLPAAVVGILVIGVIASLVTKRKMRLPSKPNDAMAVAIEQA